MKEEKFFKEIDKDYKLLIFDQKHREITLRYQILSTALLSASIGISIGFATGQIYTGNANRMIFFSFLYGLLGFITISIIFNHYFKKLKSKISNIGEPSYD